MEIRRLSCLEGARRASGTVLVIDVYRAFTCQAVAFAQGAAKILLTDDRDEALRWKAGSFNLTFSSRGRARGAGKTKGQHHSFDLKGELAGSTLRVQGTTDRYTCKIIGDVIGDRSSPGKMKGKGEIVVTAPDREWECKGTWKSQN